MFHDAPLSLCNKQALYPPIVPRDRFRTRIRPRDGMRCRFSWQARPQRRRHASGGNRNKRCRRGPATKEARADSPSCLANPRAQRSLPFRRQAPHGPHGSSCTSTRRSKSTSGAQGRKMRSWPLRERLPAPLRPHGIPSTARLAVRASQPDRTHPPWTPIPPHGTSRNPLLATRRNRRQRVRPDRCCRLPPRHSLAARNRRAP